jgi:hypothetical protein
MATYALLVDATFNSRQARDRAQTRAASEASNRGLTPTTSTFPDGQVVTGLVAVGTVGLRAAYGGAYDALTAAQDAIYGYFDANGMTGDSWAETRWVGP